MFSEPTKLGLKSSIAAHQADSQIQQIKSIGNQPRVGVLSPNVIAATGARAISTPGHVQNVQVQVKNVSDISSRVTVSFKRDPNDAFFSHALVHVSGYKGNPAPTQIASGQSPISFALENTGEPVAVHVQANGNLGPAPLQTAPSSTLQLRKTDLADQTTPSGTGIGPGAITVIQESLGKNVYPTFSTIAGHTTGGSGAGRTAATVMSGRQIMCTPLSWKFSISVNGGGVDLGTIVVLKTAIDGTAVISSTSVTFGGVSGPSLPDGIHFSDPIAFQISNDFDYWIMYHILASSAGWVDYGRQAPTPPTDYLTGLGHGEYWTTDVTGVNPIDITTHYIGPIGSQLNQVLAI